MNVRMVGGWLLAIFGVTMTLILGCERGSLGVKRAFVTGRLVDADSPATPVAGARVTIQSETPTAGLAALALGQTLTAVTNADGVFMFEEVGPDMMVLEATAQGYVDLRHPPEGAPVAAISVGNDARVDLGDLRMTRVVAPLAQATITVSGRILDGRSKEELPATTLLSVYFDGRKFGGRDITYAEFKHGLVIPAKAANIELTIIAPNYVTYRSADDPANTVNGRVDNVLNIVLTPISYDVLVRLINKPMYMNENVIELGAGGFTWAANRTKCWLTITSAHALPGRPHKVLATATIDLDDLIPTTILRGISLPASLTIELVGYRKIERPIPHTPDLQGLIAMQLDLNAHPFERGVVDRKARGIVVGLPGQVDGSVADGAKITRNTVFHLGVGDGSDPWVLRTNAPTFLRCLGRTWGTENLATPLNEIDATAIPRVFNPLPCGYILPFDITTLVASGTDFVRVNERNYYYIEPVLVPSPTQAATFTAHLLVSRPRDNLIRP